MGRAARKFAFGAKDLAKHELDRECAIRASDTSPRQVSAGGRSPSTANARDCFAGRARGDDGNEWGKAQ
eukprot:7978698-Pyramimonas_sp.AAC.1